MKFISDKITAFFPNKRASAIHDLIEFVNADSWDDLRHVAYMMATTQHETAGTYLPIVERGPKSYFNKYNAGTKLGKALGNTQEGDGYLFRGRGYCQITGRNNYRRFGALLDLDLIGQPDLALEPAIAYSIMSLGMRQGLFTGLHLWRFINDQICDYVNARKIINGLDRAAFIAEYAVQWEKRLKEAVIDDQE